MSIVNMHSHHGFVPRTPPVFSYTGDSRYLDEGGGNWRLELLTSGVLTFTSPNGAGKADVSLVAGGQPGGWGEPGYSTFPGYGGNGGNGGEVATYRKVRFKKRQYRVTIGQSGEDTVITEVGGPEIARARSGYGSPGTAGATSIDGNVSNGTPGSPLFGEPGQKRYGGGGCGGVRDGSAGKGQDGGGDSGQPANGPGGGGGGGNFYYEDAQPGQPGGPGFGCIRSAR